MFSCLRKTVPVAGLCCVCSLAYLLALGCAGQNPFLAAVFNTTLVGTQGAVTGAGGNFQPPLDPGQPGEIDILAAVDELPLAARTIQISIENASQHSAEFSMTLVVSAGPGGFVPDDELQPYLNAGYSDAIVPGSADTANVGCDTLMLSSGTRLLTLEFGINEGEAAELPPNLGGDPDATNVPTRVLRARSDGSPFIPLPEVIVLGNEDPNFVCVGGATSDALCTQRGFVYLSTGGFPIGKPVEVSRVQGTVCAENFGTAPEWRLDKSLDITVQPFEFGRGGTIVVRILDRAEDGLDTFRNQAVWTVTNADNQTLHFPDQ